VADPKEHSTLTALIKMLDEPDEKTFGVIREKIFSYGPGAIESLEKSWDNTFETIVQERITEIIRSIRMEQANHDFTNWVRFGSSDLLKGFILVSRTAYPGLDEAALTIRIEQMKMDIWLELNENLTALENIKVINHILFGMHHFEGNKIDPSDPEHFYLNILMESRRGSPVSLGILYLVLAQKLNLPVYGVNLPQHFVLAYLTDPGIHHPGADDVLFYINPFNEGAVFTRREIDLFIRQLKIKPDPAYFTPCTNTEIIQRMIRNLKTGYKKSGNPEKTEPLNHFLKILEGH
jgi:regulator of sirC expression with transglutaminase-like and TPR domain